VGCFVHLSMAVTVRSDPTARRSGPARRRHGGDTVNQALVLLVFVWAGLLIPGAVRRTRSSPHATVGGFERAMDVLRSEPRRSTGRALMVPSDAGRIVARETAGARRGGGQPRREDPVVLRRRSWFHRALVGTAVTFVTAVIVGGWLWLTFAGAFVGTATYIVVLRHHKRQRDQARRVVHELATPAEVDDAVDLAVGESPEHASVRLRRWGV
jgi:hypothetical protein